MAGIPVPINHIDHIRAGISLCDDFSVDGISGQNGHEGSSSQKGPTYPVPSPVKARRLWMTARTGVLRGS